jgi:hypothetical protein
MWLDVISASRLWYRAGLKLKDLGDIVEKKSLSEGCLFADARITFEDFYTPLSSIFAEDEAFFTTSLDLPTSEIDMDMAGGEQFEVSETMEVICVYCIASR